MVLEEFALLDRLGRGGPIGLKEEIPARKPGLWKPLQVAGHQLELGVLVGGPAGVVHGHPAVQVDGIVITREQHDVVGLPGKPAGQIGDLHLLFAGLIGQQLPDQGGAGDEAIRQLGEGVLLHVAADHRDLPVLALQDDPPVGAQQTAFVEGAVFGHHLDDLVEVLFEERRAVHQVEHIVLLQDGGAGRIGQRLEQHAGGVDGGSHIAEGDFVKSLPQVEGTPVAHQGGALVVHGHRQAVFGGLCNRCPWRGRGGRPAAAGAASDAQKHQRQDGRERAAAAYGEGVPAADCGCCVFPGSCQTPPGGRCAQYVRDESSRAGVPPGIVRRSGGRGHPSDRPERRDRIAGRLPALLGR